MTSQLESREWEQLARLQTNARGQSQNLLKVKPVWDILFGRFTVNETMTSDEDRKLNIPMTLSPQK